MLLKASVTSRNKLVDYSYVITQLEDMFKKKNSLKVVVF